MRNQLFALTVIMAFAAEPSGFQVADWSGAWTSGGGEHVSILRNVHATPRGWDQVAQNLAVSREYSITVSQTADSIAVAFPGGAGNILSTPECPIGAEASAVVTDHGDWWIKEAISARAIGHELELSSTTSTGWWKEVSPGNAQPQATDFKKRLTLTRAPGAETLSLRVVLSDEKGELEYIQSFHRRR